MIMSITLWLAFVLAIGAVTWFGSTRHTIAFLLIVLITLPTFFVPLSHPAFWQPSKGEYTVLGVKIDIDKAIYVLLDGGQEEPRYYKLPYSKEAAEQLQNAMDGTAGGGGSVRMRTGDGNSPKFFEEESGRNEGPKQQETPMFGGE